MSEREIRYRYADPVDLIWLAAANKLGLDVRRSKDVFASYDGAGTLTISTTEHFDADDSLAQMIFHELCHALVAGPAGQQREDWGLSNTDDSDLVLEHACHRLQAALAAPYGLRDFMAVTTEWRPYWDALPPDPLRAGDDPAIEIANRAYARAQQAPYQSVLQDALMSTAKIADVVRQHAEDGSLWKTTRERHRSGFLTAAEPGRKCADCAWAYEFGQHLTLRCRQTRRPGEPGLRLEPNEAACERWEPRFTIEDCGGCGACCREGFDLVQVGSRDPFRRLHPDLVQLSSIGYHVPRPEGRCLALDGDGQERPYRCQHYAERPKSCAQFEVAGDACLVARRRVGLSR